MKNHAILRAASLFVPSGERSEWIEEWQSELWYVPRSQATRFCLGAFRDAIWLRWNAGAYLKRPRLNLDSPVHCLAFLAAAAALSLWIGNRLATMLPLSPPHGVDFGQIAVIYLLLAAVAFAIGDGPGRRRHPLLSHKPRGWIFLAAKIVLFLPIMQCVMVAMLVLHIPFLFFGACFLFRWVFSDQRRRCPVCLRLLANPVRIGNSSHTLLEWYGAESMCLRGHGFLQIPEISASYCAEQWLKLDGSWRPMFS
jgi:hypothetical protein